MTCDACGADAAAGARFCAACGQPLAQRTQAPAATGPRDGDDRQAAPADEGEPAAQKIAFVRARGPFCPECRQRTIPTPYFSRGLNIAKAAMFLPLSPLAPAIFFLFRRERVICSWCKHLLEIDAQVPLLAAFSPAPIDAKHIELPGVDPVEGAPALPPGAAEAELAGQPIQHEIAMHERQGRRGRRRAGGLAVATAACGALGGGMVAEDATTAAIYLFSLGGAAGAGAFASARRARHSDVAAQALRQRQRVLEVLDLARSHAGRLNVTLAAAQLRLDLHECEALLDGMVDGRRVDIEVDDAGRITYVFPDLDPARALPSPEK